jgi:hypothetical protein
VSSNTFPFATVTVVPALSPYRFRKYDGTPPVPLVQNVVSPVIVAPCGRFTPVVKHPVLACFDPRWPVLIWGGLI